MVQILPQQPSLGELLGGGLGAGVQTGLQSILQQKQMEQQQAIKQQGLNQLLSNLGLDRQEGTSAPEQPGITAPKPETTQLERIATDPVLMSQLASTQPQIANQIEKMYSNQLARDKFEFEKAKEARKTGLITPERQEELKDVFGRQLELLKEGNIGFAKTPKLLTEKGREARAEFDTLSSSIEAALVPLVGKGTLSKQRFDYILRNLPKASDTQAKIRGKIKALTREFGIDFSNLMKEGAPSPKGDFETFNVEGKTFNIPASQVPEFKKDMGIE